MAEEDLLQQGAPELQALVGRNVRSLRHARGLTAQELVERSGVSRRMLTMIESGRANASLTTLARLASGLGVDFADLIGERSQVPVMLTEPRDIPTVWTAGRRSAARLLASATSTGSAELWDWRLSPGARYDADPDPAGSQELLFVHSGSLTLVVDATEYQVGPGTAVRMDSDRAYSYANSGTVDTVFVKVIVTAR